jgi:hypothetical protein
MQLTEGVDHGSPQQAGGTLDVGVGATGWLSDNGVDDA